MKKTLLILFSLMFLVFTGCPKSGEKTLELSNVSYDPTRQLYKEYNALFVKHWAEKTGGTIIVKQSHGGSGGQAKSVIQGQRADVVTLALSFDVDVIAEKAKLMPEDWQKRLPNNSCPYTSTIVFMVRKGNPKNIKDWNDLANEGIEIVTPNPKTSGGARWNYLAAWGYVLKNELGDWGKLKDPAAAEEVKMAQTKAREFVKKMFRNVKSMDSGARGSTVRFAERKAGDVLLAWENEALLYMKSEPGQFEIVVPSISILAEPPVALVDKNVDRFGVRAAAEEYLKLLYEKPAQEIVAKHFYRPSDAEVMQQFAETFPAVDMFTLEDVFGSWKTVQEEHFNADAVFDQMLLENAKGN